MSDVYGEKGCLEEKQSCLSNLYKVKGVEDRLEKLLADVDRVKGTVRARGSRSDGYTLPDFVDYKASIGVVREDFDPIRNNTCTSMATRLGLDPTTLRPAKKKRKSGSSSKDDDELEILETDANKEKSYKCLMTGMYFKDPMRNSKCGHRVDKPMYMQSLRTRKFNCGVPGCSVGGSRNMDEFKSVWKEDEEFKYEVESFLRRKKKNEERRKTQDDDDYDDDEIL